MGNLPLNLAIGILSLSNFHTNFTINKNIDKKLTKGACLITQIWKINLNTWNKIKALQALHDAPPLRLFLL